MQCSKCRLIRWQMACPRCYSGLMLLQQQKNQAAEKGRRKLECQLAQHQKETQLFEAKLEEVNRKAHLLARIKQKQASNKELRSSIIKKREEIQQLKSASEDQNKLLQSIKHQQSILHEQIRSHNQTLAQQRQRKQQQKKAILSHLQTKFSILLRYLAMDSVQCCKYEDWQQFITQQSDSIEEQAQECSLSEEMTLFMQMQKQAKQKMARHFVRSIKVVNLFAEIHNIQLPYQTDSQLYRVGPPLINMVFDWERNRFHLSFLKLHQANTIYLYSRACIIVQHPDVEEGRLQELHQTLLNRLKGYSLTPISLQFRKPTPMLQLQSQSLASIKVEQQTRQKQLLQNPTIQEQSQWLIRQINQYIGFKEIDSEQQDEIQLLA